MDRRVKKFYSKYPLFKRAFEDGKDVYAVAASIMFNCEYEDCLEYKKGKPFPEGKYRRTVAKKILCAMYFSTKRKYHNVAFDMIERFDFNGYKLEAKRDV